MKKNFKKIYVTVCILAVVIFYFSRQNYLDKKEIELIGTYVNNYNENINPMSIPPEAPAKIDTLILLRNNKFTSQCFGKGEYLVYERNGFQLVSLTYKEGNILAGYELTIKQKGLFSSTAILLLNINGDYYYKRIK